MNLEIYFQLRRLERMDKVRIKEIAEELGIKSKEVVEKATDIGLEVKAANSSVTQEDAEKLMNYVLTGDKPEEPELAKAKLVVKKDKVESKKEEPRPEAKSVAKKTPKKVSDFLSSVAKEERNS